MRWRKKKRTEADEVSSTAGDDPTDNDRAKDRLRGIGAMEHPSSDDDAKTIEARIRNMNYGTNRE